MGKKIFVLYYLEDVATEFQVQVRARLDIAVTWDGGILDILPEGVEKFFHCRKSME
jgi:hypothetical protein